MHHRSDPLAVSLHHTHALGHLDQTFESGFLRGLGGQTWPLRGAHTRLGAASGARTSLHHAIWGTPLLRDLAGFGGALRGLWQRAIGKGFGPGALITHETGAAGLAPHPLGSGRLDVTPPVKHESLIPPSN
jgi:hypothetical protein